MSKLRIALAGVAAIAALGIAGCTDKTKGDTETLHLTEPAKGGSTAPIGQARENNVPPGSGIAFSDPLQDSSGKEVARIHAVCIATEPPTGQKNVFLTGTCTGTVIVPGGTLAVDAGGTLGESTTGSIVGGTGKYAGAGGTFTSKTSSNGTSEDTFEIILP